jgi:hypothetical protein
MHEAPEERASPARNNVVYSIRHIMTHADQDKISAHICPVCGISKGGLGHERKALRLHLYRCKDKQHRLWCQQNYHAYFPHGADRFAKPVSKQYIKEALDKAFGEAWKGYVTVH